MIKLSVAIITYNEEKNIQRCLESVLDIADEIVIVDSFSTDQTESIAIKAAQKIPLKFIKNPFEGHIQQKNFALDQCQYDFVLSLDADEALSKKLREEIKHIKTQTEFSGYTFNRLTNYAGHWVRYCGWYPDTKLRIIDRRKARWKGVNPHDILQMNNNEQVHFLKGDLLHYSYESITSHVTQTNKFTSIAAQASYQAGVRSSLFKIVTRPLFKFLRDYFFKRGFLDGRYGFVICYINALSAFLKYSKIYEIQEGKNP